VLRLLPLATRLDVFSRLLDPQSARRFCAFPRHFCGLFPPRATGGPPDLLTNRRLSTKSRSHPTNTNNPKIHRRCNNARTFPHEPYRLDSEDGDSNDASDIPAEQLAKRPPVRPLAAASPAPATTATPPASSSPPARSLQASENTRDDNGGRPTTAATGGEGLIAVRAYGDSGSDDESAEEQERLEKVVEQRGYDTREDDGAEGETEKREEKGGGASVQYEASSNGMEAGYMARQLASRLVASCLSMRDIAIQGEGVEGRALDAATKALAAVTEAQAAVAAAAFLLKVGACVPSVRACFDRAA